MDFTTLQSRGGVPKKTLIYQIIIIEVLIRCVAPAHGLTNKNYC